MHEKYDAEGPDRPSPEAAAPPHHHGCFLAAARQHAAGLTVQCGHGPRLPWPVGMAPGSVFFRADGEHWGLFGLDGRRTWKWLGDAWRPEHGGGPSQEQYAEAAAKARAALAIDGVSLTLDPNPGRNDLHSNARLGGPDAPGMSAMSRPLREQLARSPGRIWGERTPSGVEYFPGGGSAPLDLPASPLRRAFSTAREYAAALREAETAAEAAGLVEGALWRVLKPLSGEHRAEVIRSLPERVRAKFERL
jgi:hypothetical protein